MDRKGNRCSHRQQQRSAASCLPAPCRRGRRPTVAQAAAPHALHLRCHHGSLLAARVGRRGVAGLKTGCAELTGGFSRLREGRHWAFLG